MTLLSDGKEIVVFACGVSIFLLKSAKEIQKGEVEKALEGDLMLNKKHPVQSR
jgi:hypothetical protein